MKKLFLTFILSLSIIISWADPQNGWTELPDGTIIEWGQIFGVVGDGGNYTQPFPTPFPTKCSQVVPSAYVGQFGNYASLPLNDFTNTSFTLVSNGVSNITNIWGSYIAIGY